MGNGNGKLSNGQLMRSSKLTKLAATHWRDNGNDKYKDKDNGNDKYKDKDNGNDKDNDKDDDKDKNKTFKNDDLGTSTCEHMIILGDGSQPTHIVDLNLVTVWILTWTLNVMWISIWILDPAWISTSIPNPDRISAWILDGSQPGST